MIINCKPTAIELKSFTGKSVGDLKVELEWETASETDNAGFNLYRARGNKNGKFGKYVKINGDLIPSTGGTTGDHYMYEDQVSKPGNYRYKLEDMANDETKTRHGPIKVKVRKNKFSLSLSLNSNETEMTLIIGEVDSLAVQLLHRVMCFKCVTLWEEFITEHF
ncbi:MAG: hypothetical protein U0586_05440 [Candidatus Brocadiaceae bacterium]